MIKELNYYLTTNRFSQIAEDIEKSIRDYAASVENGEFGDTDLREKARKVCQEHLEKSGLGSKKNSFINIDAEFFSGGELLEENLNRFIKDVLKAHGFQKVLWEYMGTTGLMTEVSKSAMETDGFIYESFLPIGLKENHTYKAKNKITRNFNKLKDNSGFDWTKGYDPNYTVKKNGWSGAFDQDRVWTYYENKEFDEESKKINSKGEYKIQLIKTDKGCMLYDLSGILLNPVILWYLTQNDEVYGGEQTDTIKIVENIREQMSMLGVEKITQVAAPKQTQKAIEEYSSVLGDLLSKDVVLMPSKVAEEEILRCKNIEKKSIIERKSVELQKKIEAIVDAKKDISDKELSQALESGKISVELDITNYDDAVLAGMEDSEYQLFKQLYKNIDGEKSTSFKKSVLVLSTEWNAYKSGGLSKEECIQHIFDYICENKDVDFSYETTLKDIINSKNEQNEKSEISDIRVSLEKIVKETVPSENQNAFLEYIAQLPEQKPEVQGKVFAAMVNAVENYLIIRSSTGMSIKELFDYAIKSNGGALPKSSFEPPVVGYVTPGMLQKNSTGEKRIFFDKKFSKIIEELCGKIAPTKEVSVTELETRYNKVSVEKPVVVIGRRLDDLEESMVYDFGEGDFSSPLIFELLKKIHLESNSNEDVSDPFAVKEVNASEFEKIKQLAINSETPEIFIQKLKTEFNLKYDFSDNLARTIFADYYKHNVNESVLNEYTDSFEHLATSQVANNSHVFNNVQDVIPVFTQVNVNNSKENIIQLPDGLRPMFNKSNAAGVMEKVSIVETRKNPFVIEDSAETKVFTKADSLENAGRLSIQEKKEVSVLIQNFSEAEKLELIHSAGDDWNYVTPLLVKEYLWRKENGKSVKGLVQQVSGLESLGSMKTEDLQKLLASSAVNGNVKSVAIESFENTSLPVNDVNSVPVVKLSASQKDYFKQNYGIETSGLSPVMKSYIKSGAWKKIRTNSSGDNHFGIDYNSNSYSGTSFASSVASLSSPSSSIKTSDSVKIQTGKNVRQHIDVNESYPMGDDLRKSIQTVSEKRSQNSEMSKMSRMNANYEHDKAVLAKSDPVFAKNQFWDVGHAEGDGEMSNRDLQKIERAKMNEEIIGLQNERE